jgi:hypothetical protein
MTGKPPLSITDSLELASIVCARNGGQMTDLHRRIDPYTDFRAQKQKDDEIARLRVALDNANQWVKKQPKSSETEWRSCQRSCTR